MAGHRSSVTHWETMRLRHAFKERVKNLMHCISDVTGLPCSVTACTAKYGVASFTKILSRKVFTKTVLCWTESNPATGRRVEMATHNIM